MKKHSVSYEYIFFFLFVFTQLVGTILKINTNLDAMVHLTKINIVRIFLASAIVAYPLSILAKRCLNHFAAKNKIESEKIFLCKGKYMWVFLWIGIFAVWIPYLLAYYPGIFAYDIMSQWYQYFGISQYSTHHPIIHTALMGRLIDIGRRVFGDYNKGVACYCLLQLLVLSGVISYAIYYINKMISSSKVIVLLVIYFVLFPMWPVLGISTTKDTYFAILFLTGFMILLDCCFWGIKKRRIISAIIILTVGLLFRNNAIYGILLSVLCLALFMLIKRYPKKEGIYFIMIFLSCIFISNGIFGYLIQKTHANKGSIRESLSIPCQQIARVYSEKIEELSEKDKIEIFQYIPEEEIVKYRWQLSDPIKGNLNTKLVESDWKRFFTLWIDLGVRYPREYLEATLCNTLPLWYVWDESIVSIHNCYMENYVKDVTSGKVVRNSQLPRLEELLEDAYTKGYILKFPIVSLIFIPALYVWVIIAIGFILMKYKQYKYLVLPFFLLGYIVTLMAGPCILPRYCMNFIICVPFLVICTGSIICKKEVVNE